MSFDVNTLSDQQIDALLHMTVKIPRWRLENTQTERERKRIPRAQRHLKELEEQRQEQEQLKKRRLVGLRKARAEREAEVRRKKQQQNKKPSHSKDGGLEL